MSDKTGANHGFPQSPTSIDHLTRWVRDNLIPLFLNPLGGSHSTHRLYSITPTIPRVARTELTRSEIARLRGDMVRSAWHLRRALEIYPDYPDALHRLGCYWLDQGQRDLASHYFKRATALDADASHAPVIPGVGAVN